MTSRELLALAACFLILPASVRADHLNWNSRSIQLTVQRDHSDAPVPTSIAVRNGSTEIAIVGDDHLVRIKDRNTGELVRLLETHRDWIKIALYHPAGHTLYTAGDDRTIMAWNADSERDYSLFAREDRPIEGMAVDPAGDYLATIGFNNRLNLYRLDDRSLLQSLPCPCADMRAIKFSPDSELLAIGGRNGTLRVIRVSDGSLVCDLSAHRKRIRDLVFVDRRSIVTCSDDQSLALSQVDEQRSTTLLSTNAKFHSVALLGGNRVAAGASDNLIRIVDLQQPAEPGLLSGHSGTVSALVVAGKELISGGFDTEVRVWQMDPSLVRQPIGGGAGSRLATNPPPAPIQKAGFQPQAAPATAPTKAPEFVAPEFDPPVARVAQQPVPAVTGFQIPRGQIPEGSDSDVPTTTAGDATVKSNSDSAFVIPTVQPESAKAKTDQQDTDRFSPSGFQIVK